MNCDKCGFLVTTNSRFCENCGNKINANSDISKVNNGNNKNFFKHQKKIILSGSIVIVLIMIVSTIIIVNVTNTRKEKLTNIKEVNYVKYKYGEDDLYLGKEVSDYISKGYSYDTKHITNEDYIIGDSISLMTFYKNDEAKF